MREGVDALSAGTSPDADNPVSADLIEWAEVIFAMERVHQKRLQERFKGLLRNKKVVVLGIPDDFTCMDPKLVQILEEKVSPHLRAKGLSKNR